MTLYRTAAFLAAAVVVVCLLPARAAAFPFTDPGNPGVVPMGEPLAAPDERDLAHQMQLATGLAGTGPGWTILPRITLQEMFNDNVLQAQSPRRWDLVTYIAPGVSIVGDTPHIQLRLNYDPGLAIYARTPSQNALEQQLAATGLITVIDDTLYIDTRALAGVQAANGGLGGLGGLGNGGPGSAPNGTLTPGVTGTLGLPKDNRAQTFSFGASPYLIHRFGDYGTGKIGFSLNETNTSRTSGFAPMPFPSGAGQQATRTEEIAQFETGPALSPWRSLTVIDASNIAGTQRSARRTASDKLGYMVNRSVAVFGQLGLEDISYSGPTALHISGPTWAVGTTLTPNPDSELTVSYGHHDGANGFDVNGYYALTARTRVNARYSSGLSTDLEQISNQLQLGSVDQFGNLVDSQTGGPLFGGINAIGTQQGVYRVQSLSVGATTLLDRDTIGITFTWQNQTSTGSVNAGGVPPSGTRVQAKTITGSWLRQLNPDLGLSTTVSYSQRDAPGQGGGNAFSLAANVALQYTFTETLRGVVRYTFFDRSSSVPGQSMYQDLFLVGVTKQF